jgi:hypothetical protein
MTEIPQHRASTESSAAVTHIELCAVNGPPRALIHRESRDPDEVTGSLRVALLWHLRDGKPSPRTSVSQALYGIPNAPALSDLLRHLDGVFTESGSVVVLGARVVTDRMIMADLVASGRSRNALQRYRTSPLDTWKMPTGRRPPGAREACERLVEQMAADGLAAFLHAAAARLAELESNAASSDLHELEGLLLTHAPEDDESEILLERIALAKTVPPRPVVPAAETPIVARGIRGVSERPPFARRRAALLGAFVIFIATSWTLRSLTHASAVPTRPSPLARVAILDADGQVNAFALRRDSTAALTLGQEPVAALRSREWVRQVTTASSFNALSFDPATAELVVNTSGARGLDISRLTATGRLASLVQAPGDDYSAVFSSDGRWMAYSSARGSTRAAYDVDVWLRDRWTGAERRLAVRPGSYEQPLRFDPFAGTLWVESLDKSRSISKLCRVSVASNVWDCRRVPWTIELVSEVRGDTLVGISAEYSERVVHRLTEIRWLREGVALRSVKVVSFSACSAHPLLDIALCVSDDTIAAIDRKDGVVQWQILGSAPIHAKRALFLPTDGEVSSHLQVADVSAFGRTLPIVSSSGDSGIVLQLAQSAQWRSGVLLKREFVESQMVSISGALVLPLTSDRWQGATVWIAQLPLDARGDSRALLADTIGGNGVDGFTRNGVWDASVCRLDIPRADEPEERGFAALQGQSATKTLRSDVIGIASAVPFSLQFDGRSGCTARVADAFAEVPTRVLPGRRMVIAITGRAMGTSGVVRDLVLRGASLPH